MTPISGRIEFSVRKLLLCKGSYPASRGGSRVVPNALQCRRAETHKSRAAAVASFLTAFFPYVVRYANRSQVWVVRGLQKFAAKPRSCRAI